MAIHNLMLLIQPPWFLIQMFLVQCHVMLAQFQVLLARFLTLLEKATGQQ